MCCIFYITYILQEIYIYIYIYIRVYIYICTYIRVYVYLRFKKDGFSAGGSIPKGLKWRYPKIIHF